MPVNALIKGLDILRLLNELGATQIRQLHQAAHLPKPTIVRMLETLIESGYVMRDASGQYRVTAKVLALSNGYDAADQLLRVAGPLLDRFRQEHTWPTDLARVDRDAVVILDTGRVPGTLSLNRSVGSRLPVMVTALGRAWLAFCPAEERDQALALLARSSDPMAVLARDPRAVDRLVAETRRRGYAVSDQAYLKNTRVVAVPIVVAGRVEACINMMVVASAKTMSQAEREFVPPLKRIAATIAAALARSIAA